MFKNAIRLIALVFFAASFTSTLAHAQASNGAGAGKNVVSVSYYKLPPGRQDDWLALYKKYHYPIMQWQKEHGQVISETVYKVAEHHLTPAWDIAIVIVSPPPEKKSRAEKSRSELIRSLFSDLDDYVKGERARWALTLEHWDEQWVEVDIDKNPSFYYPE